MKVRYTFTVIREAEVPPTTLEANRNWASSIAQNPTVPLYNGAVPLYDVGGETVRFKAEYKHAFLGWKRLVCLLPLLLLLGCQIPTVTKAPQSRAVPAHSAPVNKTNVTLIWFWEPMPQIMEALDPQNFKPIQYTNPPYRPATWLEGSDGGPWHQISPNFPFSVSNSYTIPATNGAKMIRSAYGWRKLIL